MDNQLKARMHVVNFFNDHSGSAGVGVIVDRLVLNGDDPTMGDVGEVVHEISIDDVYVVTFSYILRNWKALVSTMVMDDMIYEVTYDATNKRTYVDAYKKAKNVVIDDDPIEALRDKLNGRSR